MNKVFFISDPHFGHERIMSYENRPFESVQQMDETIIKNWNNKVKKEHIVYVLGDVSFHVKDKTSEIIHSLNGHKILIMGNHDRRKSVTYWKSVGFDEVSKYPILFEDCFLLSHEPRYEIADKLLYYNLHGHTHGHDFQCTEEIFYNVCVERNRYRPVDLDTIKDKLLRERESQTNV